MCRRRDEKMSQFPWIVFDMVENNRIQGNDEHLIYLIARSLQDAQRVNLAVTNEASVTIDSDTAETDDTD